MHKHQQQMWQSSACGVVYQCSSLVSRRRYELSSEACFIGNSFCGSCFFHHQGSPAQRPGPSPSRCSGHRCGIQGLAVCDAALCQVTSCHTMGCSISACCARFASLCCAFFCSQASMRSWTSACSPPGLHCDATQRLCQGTMPLSQG